MSILKAIAIFTLVCFSVNLLTGCRSMQPVTQGAPPEEIAESIKPGEQLVIVDRDFLQHAITVDSVTTNGISGSGQVFRYDEIELIYRNGISDDKTSEAATVSVAAVIVLVGAIVLIFFAGLAAAA